MHPTRLLVPALVRASLALAAGLALVLGAGVQPAAATSSVPPPVALGIHRFGHLRPPEAIVARAGPEVVGFSSPPDGADGVSYGPWSFDVAQDGSVWLLDEVNHQLLVWQPGRPNRPARAVRLPLDPLERIANFTVAPDHTIYATYVPHPGPGPRPYGWPHSLPAARSAGPRQPPMRSSTPSCASAPTTPCSWPGDLGRGGRR
jgi:hypothetical protein